VVTVNKKLKMKRVEVTHIPAKRSKKTSEETYYAKNYLWFG
jgi:hypothetical protein